MLCRRLSPALLLSKREMLNPNAWALFRHERFYSFLGSFAGPSAHSPASSSCFGAPNFGGHQGRSMSSASSSRVGGVDASRFVEIASGINEDQPSLLVLHDMQNNKGAHKKKRRIGRGNGSSKGNSNHQSAFNLVFTVDTMQVIRREKVLMASCRDLGGCMAKFCSREDRHI